MCPDQYLKNRMPSSRVIVQRGFSIVSAIFLLVVLAALGTFMVTFSTVQHTTSMQDIQGARAYQAARTGIEWGVFQILQNNGGAPFPSNCRPGSAPTQTLPALGGTLTGFTVNVNCSATQYTEGVNTFWVYQITSTATVTGSAVGQISYIQRQIQATIQR